MKPESSLGELLDFAGMCVIFAFLLMAVCI